MKAKIKMGEREYEGDLEICLHYGYASKWAWLFTERNDSEKTPDNDKFPFTYEFLGGRQAADYETTCTGYRDGFLTKAEALADAKAHGITVEGK